MTTGNYSKYVNYINFTMQSWGCIITLLTLICLRVNKFPKNKRFLLYKHMIVFNTLTMIFDIISIIYNGKISDVSLIMNKLGNIGSYLCNYLLLSTFVHYLTEFIRLKTNVSKIPLFITRILCTSSLIMVIINHIFPIFYKIDSNNIYHRTENFWISQILGIFCLIICLFMIIKYNKYLDGHEKLTLWVYVTFPIFSLVLQIHFYGLVLLNIMDTILLMIGFVELQAQQGKKISQQEILMAKQNKEMTSTRLSIALTQLQPHFLNNSLNIIYHLCDYDPQLAKKTIKDFSIYLRNNLDSISIKTPIPFNVELKHIETYLSIEKLRFRERLNIKYDIETTDFHLPALSVQPIVENAVLHGICQNEDGGTVTISTKKILNSYQIIISDDGVGYDTSKIKNDGVSHIGIENVRNRLKIMSNGTLEIESKIGIGTKAIITIPKEV